MTVQVRIATIKDEPLWNKYVYNHSRATPYHRFGWLKSVEQAYQHKNMAAIALQDNQIVGVLPCIQMQRPLLRPAFCALPYCDLGYALGDDSAIVELLTQFINQQLSAANGQKFEFRDVVDVPTEDSQMEGQKVRMLLALPETSEELLSGFKSKLRSQIRKSEKNGLRYEIFKNGQGLDDFYHIFAINMRKLGSPVHSKEWFKHLLTNYQGNCVLSVVYSEDIPIGAGITLSNNQNTVIPWASTVAEYNKLAPNMLLYWSLLKEACDNNMRSFDFGRSTFGEGTYRFKAQWGAVPQLLNWYNAASQTSQNFTVQDNDERESAPKGRLRPLVESIWAKLPLGLTTSVGPKIRKHISL